MPWLLQPSQPAVPLCFVEVAGCEGWSMFSLLTFARPLLQDVLVLVGTACLSPGLPGDAATAQLSISSHCCRCDSYLQTTRPVPWGLVLQTLQKPPKTPRGRTPTLCHPGAPGQRLTPGAGPTYGCGSAKLHGLGTTAPARPFRCIRSPWEMELGTVSRRSVFCCPQQCLREVCGSLPSPACRRAVRGWGQAAGEAGALGENRFGDIFRS